SFTEAPGLRNSHLPQISHSAASLGPLRRTSGVLPINSSVLLAVAPVMADWLRPPCCRRNANALSAREEALAFRSIFLGDRHPKPVELVGQRDLAGKARILVAMVRAVEQVVFVLAHRREQVLEGRIDMDVAGGAAAAAAA